MDIIKFAPSTSITERLLVAESEVMRGYCVRKPLSIYLGVKEHGELREFIMEYNKKGLIHKIVIEGKVNGENLNRIIWRGYPVYLVNAESHLEFSHPRE